MEGSSDKVKKNEQKGINWLKEAIKNNHIPALEFKCYYDIRFDKQPKIKKIIETLETIADKTKSARALNTLGEFELNLGQEPKCKGTCCQILQPKC